MPQWVLSAYGPILDAPRQLFGGPGREISFEEMRLFHYGLHTSGNQQQAIQQAQSLVQQAQQQNQVALNDVDGAIRYILDGGKEHPNRLDICENVIRASSTNVTSVPLPTIRPSNPFAPSATSGTGFQSTIGTNTQSFDPSSTPSTGFQNGPGTNTQLFAPSSKSGTRFQNPTGTGTQPFAPSSAPSVGFQSTPGTMTQPFVQSSTSGTGFQTTTDPSTQPFTPSSSTGTGFQIATSRYTQPIASLAIPGIGFQTAAGVDTRSFGAPSASGNSFQTTTDINSQPFPPVTRHVFSKPITGPAKPFTGFTLGPGQDPADPKAANPLAPVTGLPSSNPLPSAGISTSSLSTGSTPSSDLVQRPSATKAVKDSAGRLTRWDGKPVAYIDKDPCYKGADGSWVKIWFPIGAPEYREVEELPMEAYDEATKENYKHVREHGTFKDGVMPTVAPRREWCRWDF